MDLNVKSLIKRLEQRARKGMETYGVDTTRTDLGVVEWLDHREDEGLDDLVYGRAVRGRILGVIAHAKACRGHMSSGEYDHAARHIEVVLRILEGDHD